MIPDDPPLKGSNVCQGVANLAWALAKLLVTSSNVLQIITEGTMRCQEWLPKTQSVWLDLLVSMKLMLLAVFEIFKGINTFHGIYILITVVIKHHLVLHHPRGSTIDRRISPLKSWPTLLGPGSGMPRGHELVLNVALPPPTREMFRSMLGSCLKGHDTEKVILVNGGLHHGNHPLSTFGWKDFQNQVAVFLISWHCPFAKVFFCSLNGCRDFFFGGLGAVVCLADCRFTYCAESLLYSLSLSMILMIALIILANLHPFQMIREFHCLGWRKQDGNWAWLGSISRLLSVRHLHLWKARKGRHATRFLRSFVWGC